MLREANSRPMPCPHSSTSATKSRAAARVYKLTCATPSQELFSPFRHGLESSDLQKKMRAADNKLRSCVGRSEFMWARILQPIYPENPFWWLYHRPIPQDD
jgi:hypothetical protein